MTIKEAQEQIKSTSFVENADIFHKQSFKDRADTLALFTIIEALQNGYQLCRVYEMKKNIKNKSTMMADCNYPLGDSMEYGLYVKDIEEIIKEACE